ncbi:hypothetical protein TNCV_2340161 [Trichonephila clavipes]|nr:hypothetical protein TNCV_2340161 [Trichonephila clavipes]
MTPDGFRSRMTLSFLPSDEFAVGGVWVGRGLSSFRSKLEDNSVDTRAHLESKGRGKLLDNHSEALASRIVAIHPEQTFRRRFFQFPPILSLTLIYRLLRT